MPKRRVNHSRIPRFETEIHCPGNIVLVQNFLPAPSTVSRAENAALLVRTEAAAHRRHQHDIRIAWIDQDPSNVPRFRKSKMLPRRSRINGFVNSIPIRDVGIEIIFPAPHINDARIRRRKRQCPNRRDRLLVENWLPHRSAIGRLPHASAIRPEIINARISRHTSHGIHFPAAKRPNHPPFHFRIERRGDFLSAVDPRQHKSRGPQDRGTKDDSKCP